MKLIHVITHDSGLSSRGNPIPVVRCWTGTEWVPVIKVWREYQDDHKEHSYFMLRDPFAVYMVETNLGCDGTTFLNGEGAVISRETGLRKIGVAGAAVEVRIPQKKSF